MSTTHHTGTNTRINAEIDADTSMSTAYPTGTETNMNTAHKTDTRTDTDADGNTRSIVVDFDLPQSPERVWRALTDPTLVEQWLMPNDLQPRVGHRFQFHTQPVAGWDGTVDCEVLTVEPQRRLAYSWRGGSTEIQGYGHRLDTTVTWTLTPQPGGGTHLRLEHAGFRPEDSFAYENMDNGWRSQIATALERVVAGLD